MFAIKGDEDPKYPHSVGGVGIKRRVEQMVTLKRCMARLQRQQRIINQRYVNYLINFSQ